MTIQETKKKIIKALDDKEKEMYCAVEGCGRIDETYTAYCIKHGRSLHKMRNRK